MLRVGALLMKLILTAEARAEAANHFCFSFWRLPPSMPGNKGNLRELSPMGVFMLCAMQTVNLKQDYTGNAKK